MSNDSLYYLPHGLSMPSGKRNRPTDISISADDIKIAMKYIIEIHKEALCKKIINIEYLYYSEISHTHEIPMDRFIENDLMDKIKKCKGSDYIGISIRLIRVKLNRYIKMYGSEIVKKLNNFSIKEIAELDVNKMIDYHLNMVIIDNKNKQIERFEPIGTKVVEQTCNIDSILAERFPSYKYFTPIDFCPNISFQGVDKLLRKQLGLSKEPGACTIWSLWYLDTRLLNKTIDRGELIESILDRIKIHKAVYIQDIIYNYWYNITKFIKIIKQDKISSSEAINKMYSEQYERPIKRHKLHVDLNID